MRYLFVGGPRHGEFVELSDNRRTWLVPVFPPFPTAVWGNAEAEAFLNTPTIQTCEYERADVGTDRLVYLAKRTSS